MQSYSILENYGTISYFYGEGLGSHVSRLIVKYIWVSYSIGIDKKKPV